MDKEYFQSPEVATVSKVKCLKSIMFYTKYFFYHQYNRRFIVGEHHKIICEALERVLSGKCKRLIINIAPRYGKTELVVKSLIGNGLALNPAAKFIHLSYSDDLAKDNSEAVKDLVQTVEYQQLFPKTRVKRDSRAKDKWYTTEGGGVLARAAAGQVTGFGAGEVDQEELEIEAREMDFFMPEGEPEDQASEDPLINKLNFAGAIIIDDPIKPEDADQDTVREKVNSRFDSTIRNRVNSRNTPIIVIMQRLHPNDLCGYLQRDDEADEWEVISMPCLITEQDGTERALWPHKHTVPELKALEKSNDLVFERQYQQNPKPKTGLLFPEDELHYADMDKVAGLSDPDFTFQCADPANEGGDDFAGAPFKLVGDKIYVTEVLYNTMGADHNEKAFAKMVLRNSLVGEVGVEGVLGWKETAKRIKEFLDDKGFQGEFRVLRPRTKKHTRILNRASFIRNNMVFRKDWQDHPQYAKFMRCLTSYMRIQEAGRENKHDDAPDLCEMAASYFEKNFPHIWNIKE